MKVAFIAHGFPPDLGGTELYNVEYARRLAERGHDLRLLTWESRTAGADAHDAGLPFEVRRLPARRVRKRVSEEGVLEALRAWGSEVVFLSRGSKAMPRVARAAAKHAPLVVSMHELREKHRRRGAFGRLRIRHRYGLAYASRVTVNSDDTKVRIVALGYPEDRVTLVYPGADVSAFAPDPEAGARVREALGVGGKPLLLTVSRLADNKGHDQVLDALSAIRERVPDATYVIVGEGATRAPLEQKVHALGLGDAVIFTGRVPDVRAYYHACDVYVMVSTPLHAGSNAGEGFGIAYVEAGAAGKPVVASTSGGGAEIVVEGETGRLVTPRDRDALASALVGLLEDPEARRRMGEAGKERVARYDWGLGVLKLEEALRAARGA